MLLGLLSFYDEPRELLALCIDGLARAGVGHVVAVDGRYALYPPSSDVSPAEQRAVIDGACRHHGIGLTMHVPPGPWEGNEPEKRTRMFALALGAASPGDWFFVCDADMAVTEAPPDLLARLDAAEEESAEVMVRDMAAVQAKRRDWPERHPFRGLFRAQPIVVGPQHYVYRSLDGRPLWCGPSREGLDAPLDLTDCFLVEHRPMSRSPGRNLMKGQYYTRRDHEGVEMGPCARCGEEQATRRTRTGLRLVHGIPTGKVVELCGGCADKAEGENRRRLLRWGMNPGLEFNERYAPPEAEQPFVARANG